MMNGLTAAFKPSDELDQGLFACHEKRHEDMKQRLEYIIFSGLRYICLSLHAPPFFSFPVDSPALDHTTVYPLWHEGTVVSRAVIFHTIGKWNVWWVQHLQRVKHDEKQRREGGEPFRIHAPFRLS